MTKLSKEKKDKLILVGLAFFGVIAVLYFFVIADQRERVADYQLKAASLKEKVQKAEQFSKMAPLIQERLGAQKRVLESKQEDMVSRGDPYYSFFQIMEKFRKQHDVEVIDISQPLTGEAGLLPGFQYKAAIFTVTMAAYYHDLGKYLADLENSFPYMRVQNMTIHPEGAGRNRLMAGSELPNSTLVAGAERTEKLAIEFKVVTLIRPVNL